MTQMIAVYGGSFNPPHVMHEAVARAVAASANPRFDAVVIPPCGSRPDKLGTDDISPLHRAAMADIAFRSMPKAEVDLFDLEGSSFTRQFDLDARYTVDGNEVWHVVGTDLTRGGARGESDIQRKWHRGTELWQKLRFVVVVRRGHPFEKTDLPPRSVVLEIGGTAEDAVAGASSEEVRNRAFRRMPYSHLVSPAIREYMERYNLYRTMERKTTSLCLADPRPFFVFDQQNPKAAALYERYRGLAHPLPLANCIVTIGGDGMMIRTIREHWRMRLPFVGVNAGHAGYLLNDPVDDLSPLLADLRVHLLRQLAVDVTCEDGRTERCYAVNDCWVRDTGQAAWLNLTVGKETRQVIGDGALVCTPAGSTGYSRAMGAPPLTVDTDYLQLVGNNIMSPHGWKYMPVAALTPITIEAAGGAKRQVQGWVDGVPYGIVRKMHSIGSNIASAELAFSPKRDLMAKLYSNSLPSKQTLFPF